MDTSACWNVRQGWQHTKAPSATRVTTASTSFVLSSSEIKDTNPHHGGSREHENESTARGSTRRRSRNDTASRARGSNRHPARERSKTALCDRLWTTNRDKSGTRSGPVGCWNPRETLRDWRSEHRVFIGELARSPLSVWCSASFPSWTSWVRVPSPALSVTARRSVS